MKLGWLSIFLILLSNLAFAEIKIKDVRFVDDRMYIDYEGQLNNDPVLLIDQDKVQVSINDAVVWPKIEKVVENSTSQKLMAYQYTKDLVRVRSYINKNLVIDSAKVHMGMGNNTIWVQFPKSLKATTTSVAGLKKDSTKFDESLLDQLIVDKNNIAQNQKTEEVANSANIIEEALIGAKEDSVKTTQSSFDSVPETPKSTFSLSSYIGKFVAFIGVILLGFYGVMQLMRKGVIKKGKLGFLNNGELVKVLSTTHIAPKKSLLLVRAHKQVFLVSNSEAGMQLISEVQNVAEILKEGEFALTGSNFDSNMNSAEAQDSISLNLKEDINKSTPVDLKASPTFSDKLKEKVKGLKPLH